MGQGRHRAEWYSLKAGLRRGWCEAELAKCVGDKQAICIAADTAATGTTITATVQVAWVSGS